MKIIVAALFAAASFTVAPLPVAASTLVAQGCSDSVPDSWKRPGGYCDSMTGNGSLSNPSANDLPNINCPVASLAIGERLHLAAPATDACGNPINPCPIELLEDPGILAEGNRLLVVC